MPRSKHLRTVICSSEGGPVRDERTTGCPRWQNHTPGQPMGYLEWWAWARVMGKTHVQQRCRSCRLWAIWVPR